MAAGAVLLSLALISADGAAEKSMGGSDMKDKFVLLIVSAGAF